MKPYNNWTSPLDTELIANIRSGGILNSVRIHRSVCATAPVGNGGKTDLYTWTQSLQQVEAIFDIPKDTISKQINIEFTSTHVSIRMKGNVVVDADVHAKIDCENSTWTLEQEVGKPTKTLTIYLVKVNKMEWWNRVFVGHDTIDTSKIVPENSQLSDLDPDTRGTVEKMMVTKQKHMT